jgi:hypothetical protein
MDSPSAVTGILKKTRSNFSTDWICSWQYDGVFFIASFICAIAFIILYYRFNVGPLVLFVVFQIFFDLPHNLTTLYAVCMDQDEKKSKVFGRSFGWFLLAPSAVVVGELLGSNLPLWSFFFFLSLYGSWHVFRQHFGFLRIYAFRAKESDTAVRKSDYFLFHFIFILGILSLHFRSLGEHLNFFLPVAFKGVGEILFSQLLFNISFFTYLSVLISLPLHRSIKINLPKLLLVLSSLGFLALLVNSKLLDGAHHLFYVAVFTLHHAVQYKAFVFFYGKKNFKEHPLGKYLFSGAFRFLGTSFALAFFYVACVWWIFGALAPNPVFEEQTELGKFLVTTRGTLTVKDFAYILFAGIPLQHYYLDQKIWHLSDGLGKSL